MLWKYSHRVLPFLSPLSLVPYVPVFTERTCLCGGPFVPRQPLGHQLGNCLAVQGGDFLHPHDSKLLWTSGMCGYCAAGEVCDQTGTHYSATTTVTLSVWPWLTHRGHVWTKPDECPCPRAAACKHLAVDQGLKETWIPLHCPLVGHTAHLCFNHREKYI